MREKEKEVPLLCDLVARECQGMKSLKAKVFTFIILNFISN